MKITKEQLENFTLEELVKNLEASVIERTLRIQQGQEHYDEAYNIQILENYIYENLSFI